jgi:hypothetical protein
MAAPAGLLDRRLEGRQGWHLHPSHPPLRLSGNLKGERNPCPLLGSGARTMELKRSARQCPKKSGKRERP